MGRGFLSGSIWGVFVSGVALVATSQVAEYTSLSPPKPETGAINPPAGSGFDQNRPESRPNAPQIEMRPGDDATPAPVSDTTPASQPETSMSETGLEAQVIGATPEVTVAQGNAVLPSPAAAPPAVPGTDIAPLPETEEVPVAEVAPEANAMAVAEPEAAAEPEVVAESDALAAPDAPSVVVSEIENLAPGVATDRLPRIGAVDETPTDTAPDQPASARH